MRKLACLLLLVPMLLQAAEKKEKKYDLNDFAWGKIISGPAITEASTKDKGIILFGWANEKQVHGEENMERLSKINEEYSNTVFMVAVELTSQYKTAKEQAELGKAVKKANVKVPVAAGMKKLPEGKWFKTTPACFIFNSKKVLIYEGYVHGDEFKQAMEEAGIVAGKPGSKPATEEKPAAKDPKKGT
ncbi:MAG: hypothetical protein EBQ59_02845 [Verrucomicrobia bacterium]|jgi:hypothetical protein|nr:hypothetical protein [Verrucomicrobiota bacterium]